MDYRVGLASCALLALSTCVAEFAADKHEVEPAVAASALLEECSLEDWTPLFNVLSDATPLLREAQRAYSPDHPAAVRYFGTRHRSASVAEILGNAADIAESDDVEFSCESEEVGRCLEFPNSVLYVNSGELVIHACGDRLWSDEYLRGVDEWAGTSVYGIMIHELAHLGGATGIGGVALDIYGEDQVLSVANMNDGDLSFAFADAYRFYVMRLDDF